MVSCSVVNNDSERDKQVGGQTVGTQTDSTIRTVCTDGIGKENEHDIEPENAKSCP